MSTHGTLRILSAPRLPKPTKSTQKRKGKVIGESSELRKPLKIKITTKSIAVHENAKEAEARENVDMVEKQILAEDVEKLVEGDRDDESFVDSLLKKQKGSQEIRDVEKQTTILTTPRSLRTNLTSDKEPVVELTDTDEQMTDVASRSKYEMVNLCVEIKDTFDNGIIPHVAEATRKVFNHNLQTTVRLEMQKEAIGVKDNLSSLATQEIAATTPQQFEAFLQNIYAKSCSYFATIFFKYFHPWFTTSTLVEDEGRSTVPSC
ncbi:hypothetical protein Tco_1117501 [Tanacetum coccineum]